ncbi:MAG: LuxR C-terminal-related transcriptional regulator [Gammaproteobacteria bacterium]|nr:LuxR C-terminal-related transcriptional regulator [Gammaproteobacteria bacterium]
MTLKNYYPTIVLASATLFFAYDIVADLLSSSESLLHILVEFLVFVAILTVLLTEMRRVSRLTVEVSAERTKTARLSGELLAVMRGQFTDWGLSPSESEVALLLIKGLSMREISQAREVKEKTVRQQATGVYAKSGYAGRHELVAHFIEDLMNHEPPPA